VPRVRFVVAALAIVVTALAGSSDPDGWSNGAAGAGALHAGQVAGQRWDARKSVDPLDQQLAIRLSGRHRTSRS
jgi:hypothetical protein